MPLRSVLIGRAGMFRRAELSITGSPLWLLAWRLPSWCSVADACTLRCHRLERRRRRNVSAVVLTATDGSNRVALLEVEDVKRKPTIACEDNRRLIHKPEDPARPLLDGRASYSASRPGCPARALVTI